MHIHASYIKYHTSYSSSNITCSKVLKSITVHSFGHPVGLQEVVPNSVLGTFFLFFTQNLLEYIVQQTNKFALECMGEEKYETWDKINVDDLRAFMGFMILMGIVHLPSIGDYWKKDDMCHYAPIASRISRKRFFVTQRYLHFVDNSTLAPPGSANYQNLGKVQPVIDFLSDRFRTIYNIHRDVSVDEAMIPFKGRSSMKQYLPLKPVKRGFKVWMLADAVNGYVSGFEVYTGKKGEKSEKGLGARVVKSLCQPIQNRYIILIMKYSNLPLILHLYHRYHHVYFDNFFSSIDLLLDLQKVDVYGCGTLRANRKSFPYDLKPLVKKGLGKRGECAVRQHHNLTVSLWQDNRAVAVISANSDPMEVTTVQRKTRDGTRNTIDCPQSIYLYNKYMGGVDHNDQLRQYYNVRLKGRKYYKCIWWFLFDVAITNAYILGKNHTDLSIPSLKSFRLDLAEGLIGEYRS